MKPEEIHYHAPKADAAIDKLGLSSVSSPAEVGILSLCRHALTIPSEKPYRVSIIASQALIIIHQDRRLRKDMTCPAHTQLKIKNSIVYSIMVVVRDAAPRVAPLVP